MTTFGDVGMHFSWQAQTLGRCFLRHAQYLATLDCYLSWRAQRGDIGASLLLARAIFGDVGALLLSWQAQYLGMLKGDSCCCAHCTGHFIHA